MCSVTIVETGLKLEELVRAVNDAEFDKKKLELENQDLNQQIEETESLMAHLSKTKVSLITQLEDTKHLADAESRERAVLLTKYKSLSTDLENLRIKIDEEAQKKTDNLRALSKAEAEIQLWRTKFETEGSGRVEELEDSLTKLKSRLAEAEECIEHLSHNIVATEKCKVQLEADLDVVQLEYERIYASTLVADKIGRTSEKVIRVFFLQTIATNFRADIIYNVFSLLIY